MKINVTDRVDKPLTPADARWFNVMLCDVRYPTLQLCYLPQGDLTYPPADARWFDVPTSRCKVIWRTHQQMQGDLTYTPADARWFDVHTSRCKVIWRTLQNKRTGAHLIRIPRKTLRASKSAGGSGAVNHTK